ncbi:ethanolamine ammonia-lyase subunit EutC [Streptococcus devriesei]|uniref:ethanolamine ammonia-lyase subunit EutC n=1 Tax=Streptococcus devriesei TaxID=231233 RepID=UPI0003FBD35C|nr:ethanolamine ammonia-lyase subunit EutC [Streptococcus devriesei]
MNDQELKVMIQTILSEVIAENKGDIKTDETLKKQKTSSLSKTDVSDEELPDISAIRIQDQYLVPTPLNKEAFAKLKAKTPARVGLWRTGTRYLTEPMLRFRLDHAAAQDAVFSDVDESLIQKMNFIPVKTICKDKDEYLTRPDFGRKFDDENAEIIRSTIKSNAKVAVIVGDGLSSAAIEANIEQVLPSLKQGLQNHNLEIGDILFIKYCRVPAMDQIGDITNAEVICLLVGERPGLATAESMSAYMAYRPHSGLAEAKRTVISNIHSGGTPAVEAGAYIADTIQKMLDAKKSGVDLY